MLGYPPIAGLAPQIEQVLEQWRGVVTFAGHRKFFHDRTGLNNVKSYRAKSQLIDKAVLGEQMQHAGNRSKL